MPEQYEPMKRNQVDDVNSQHMKGGLAEIHFGTTKDHYQNMDNDIHPKEKMTWCIIMMTLAAACGGFLFGYDTGVVSGAMLKIQEDLDLSAVQEEVVVSSTIAAAVLASALGGRASQLYGRRPVLLFAASTFSIGALMLGFAPNYEFLVVARIIVGIGIGLASLTAPVYIAESAPTHMRGRLLTLNTFLITIGQFIAGMVDGILSSVDGGWRWMLGISGIPAVIMGTAFLFLPESPRWLMQRGRAEESEIVLRKVRGSDDVSKEIDEIVQSLRDGGEAVNYGWKELWHDKPVRKALILGCGLQALQQFVGINTVMYYSATIYYMAGFSVSGAIWLAGFTALAQSGGVLIGVMLIERKGRRTLLLTSLALVTLSLVVLGLSFYLQLATSESATVGTSVEDAECSSYDNIFFGTISITSCYQCLQLSDCGFCTSTSQCLASGTVSDVDGICTESDWEENSCSNGILGWFAVLSMVAYLLFFGIGLSSVPWTINAEIYPQRARSFGTSVSTSVNWIGNVIISATFLSIASPTLLSQHGAFWLYAAVAVAGFLWAYIVMPETAGLPLERVQSLFEDGSTLRKGSSFLYGNQENLTSNSDIRVQGNTGGTSTTTAHLF